MELKDSNVTIVNLIMDEIEPSVLQSIGGLRVLCSNGGVTIGRM